MTQIKKWIAEIHKVGIRDWAWFVIYLHRNEFSGKLDMEKYYPDMMGLVRARDRAHRIDMILSGQGEPSWAYDLLGGKEEIKG